MAVVIDNFLDEQSCDALRSKFPVREGDVARMLPTLQVQLQFAERMQIALSMSSQGQGHNILPIPASACDSTGPLVPMVARMASGSVPMHQDCFSPFDAAETGFIDGYVAVLYVDGAGTFVIETGDGEQTIDIIPGRFIAWPNGLCRHRLDAAQGGGMRAMLGPLAIDAGGLMQRAHDVWSTHPGYIGMCKTNAARAETEGDDAAVRRELCNIGVPAIAADLLREYEERQHGKPSLVVTLSLSQSSSGFLLTGTGINGESLLTLTIEKPEDAKYGAVAKELKKEVGNRVSGVVFKFVLSDGTLLGEAHDDLDLAALFKADVSDQAAAAAVEVLPPAVYEVGHHVRVVADGRVGTIVRKDAHDVLPYKVEFDNHPSDWFRAGAVELVREQAD